MSIVVMVDGGANLSKSILNKYDIALLPYNVIFSNGDTYKDSVDIKNQRKLIELINQYNELPKIDILESDKIENYFRKYIDKGNDILYISVSSMISNSYNDAIEISKKFDSNTIEIVDSLNVAGGETLLALDAKDYIDKGQCLKQTVKYLNLIKQHIKSCCIVGDSTCLYRQCKCKKINDNYMEFYEKYPIVEMDNGRIVVTFSTNEYYLAIQMLKNKIIDYYNNIDNNHVIISYSGNKSYATKVKNFILKQFKDCNIELVENSSAVYINSGINTLTIAFLSNKKLIL